MSENVVEIQPTTELPAVKRSIRVNPKIIAAAIVVTATVAAVYVMDRFNSSSNSDENSAVIETPFVQ